MAKMSTPAHKISLKKAKLGSITGINDIMKKRGTTPKGSMVFNNHLTSPDNHTNYNVKKIKIDLGFSLSPEKGKRSKESMTALINHIPHSSIHLSDKKVSLKQSISLIQKQDSSKGFKSGVGSTHTTS